MRTLEEWWFFIKINNKELSIKNKKINALINKIEEIINNSKVPEDPIHSKNTLTWVYRLEKDVDIPLIISALGHDIERAIEDLKVKRADYETYNEFKKAHALNSAKILKKIMTSRLTLYVIFVHKVSSKILTILNYKSKNKV